MSGKPTFSTVGQQAPPVISGLSIDRVSVDVAGSAHLLDHISLLTKTIEKHTDQADANMQALLEAASGCFLTLDKIAFAIGDRKGTVVNLPEICPVVQSPQITNNIEQKIPWPFYLILSLNLLMLVLTYLK